MVSRLQYLLVFIPVFVVLGFYVAAKYPGLFRRPYKWYSILRTILGVIGIISWGWFLVAFLGLMGLFLAALTFVLAGVFLYYERQSRGSL